MNCYNIFMVYVLQEFDFLQSLFCIDFVVEGVVDFFDCNFFFCFGIYSGIV